MTADYFIGLMSGTSLDGIDAVLVDLSRPQPVLTESHHHAWPDSIHQALLTARELDDDQLATLHELDRQTAEVFAEAVHTLLDKAGLPASAITAIGSHGQTVRHRPDARPGFSLQLGEAKTLAALTGICVVADFRSADIHAGGQGAPLVPAFHQAVFRDPRQFRVVLNIGGIANVTMLPNDPEQTVTGFDTGPGNTLMDAWMREHCNREMDENGRFAASGVLHDGLLSSLLDDAYFHRKPPKSTGFEHFNLSWLKPRLQALKLATPGHEAAIQRTLLELTARSIIDAIDTYAPACDDIVVCGGGAHNTCLMQRLQTLGKAPLRSTAALGIHPDWVEAMTFAWLARQRLLNRPGNLPTVTGASRACLLGTITPA